MTGPVPLRWYRQKVRGPGPLKVGRLVRYRQRQIDPWLQTQVRTSRFRFARPPDCPGYLGTGSGLRWGDPQEVCHGLGPHSGGNPRARRTRPVEETDGVHPGRVYNQPAGHVDPGEGLLEALVCQVREETGPAFTAEAYLGITLARAGNGRDYARVCFVGLVPEGREPAPEESVILGCAWLTRAEAAPRPRSGMNAPLPPQHMSSGAPVHSAVGWDSVINNALTTGTGGPDLATRGARSVENSRSGNEMLGSVLRAVPPGAAVLDFGCLGWQVLRQADREGLSFAHWGCDMAVPERVPAGTRFELVEPDPVRLGFEDDCFDLVVATHVLEHVANPLEVFREWVRICKPGGLIYLEAPSERAMLCRSDPDVEAHNFFSFWDDPTHRRPWPPAAMYRLALSHQCEPVRWGYLGSWADRVFYPFHLAIATLRGCPAAATPLKWRANRWVSFAVIRKPMELRGLPEYRFISLQSVAPGKANAMAGRGPRNLGE